MNIKINTTEKIITIEDSLVSFSELVAELDKLIPNWKEYQLEGVKREISFVPYPPYYPNYPNWITLVQPWVQPLDMGTYTTCDLIEITANN